MMNHKQLEQNELDAKIAPFMQYFEIPYYEQYIVLTWEAIQKQAEIMYPEIKGKPIQMAGVIIDWEANPEKRFDVLREHLAHMLGWIQFDFRLQFPDPQEAAFQHWGGMAKYVEYLETQFKTKFNLTVDEYGEKKWGKSP